MSLRRAATEGIAGCGSKRGLFRMSHRCIPFSRMRFAEAPSHTTYWAVHVMQPLSSA